MAGQKICTGCLSTRAIEDLQAAGFLSCCPERQMVDGVFCPPCDDICYAPECMANGCVNNRPNELTNE